MFVPLVFASVSDAIVAFRRVSDFLVAEEIGEPYSTDPESKWGVEVDGDFACEAAVASPKDSIVKSNEFKGKGNPEKEAKGKKNQVPVLPIASEAVQDESIEDKKREKETDKPFELKNLKMRIPRGAFVAIVGPVGSGKSSILQSLIGEMRAIRGEVCCLPPVL